MKIRVRMRSGARTAARLGAVLLVVGSARLLATPAGLERSAPPTGPEATAALAFSLARVGLAGAALVVALRLLVASAQSIGMGPLGLSFRRGPFALVAPWERVGRLAWTPRWLRADIAGTRGVALAFPDLAPEDVVQEIPEARRALVGPSSPDAMAGQGGGAR